MQKFSGLTGAPNHYVPQRLCLRLATAPNTLNFPASCADPQYEKGSTVQRLPRLCHTPPP